MPRQVIAALLIFLAGYLALALGTTKCLVAAVLICGHASVVREYGVRSASMNTHVLSEIDGGTRRASRQHLASRLSDSLTDASSHLVLAFVRNQSY